jgi:hypothetical protein
MALALYNGATIQEVSGTVQLTASFSYPMKHPLPQFLKFSNETQTFNKSLSGLFEIFRRIGPIVSVRKNVDVGYGAPCIVVQYVFESCANSAKAFWQQEAREQGLPNARLQTINFRNLYCTVSNLFVQNVMCVN